MPPPPQGWEDTSAHPFIFLTSTHQIQPLGLRGKAQQQPHQPPWSFSARWLSFHSICKESRHPSISEPVPLCAVLMCCRYKPSTVRKTQNWAELKLGFSLPLALSVSALQTSHRVRLRPGRQRAASQWGRQGDSLPCHGWMLLFR